MSTSNSTEVQSPEEEYSVGVDEVWEVMDVPVEARELSDTVILQNIREAMLVVEDVAGPDSRPEDRKTVVLSRAGEYTLSNHDDGLISSMDALDVSIEYDVQAKREQLQNRGDRLLDAIKPDNKFIFRSL